MKITINGMLVADKTDQLFNAIDKNTYNGLGEAITHKITDAIHNTEWYQYNPGFQPVRNVNDILAYCGDNAKCFLDYMDWNILNKTELTTDIYKFLAHRSHIIRDGLENGIIPGRHFDWASILDLIDWHFILDCISWFF